MIEVRKSRSSVLKVMTCWKNELKRSALVRQPQNRAGASGGIQPISSGRSEARVCFGMCVRS